MHTKRQIESLLAAAGVSPHKRLGQHFLIDLNLMRLLVDSADLHTDDVVLEVGCGTGSLTEALAERAGFVVGVEVDRTLASLVTEQLKHKANVHVVTCDVLESKHRIAHSVAAVVEQARQVYGGRLVLVANLPYHVGSPVMINLVRGPVCADAMSVTVQKEVAERMCASPGTPDYGILGIFLQATGQVTYLRTLKRSVFWPQPQVESAMVGFTRDPGKVKAISHMGLFNDVVDLFLGHRRKMLKSAARSGQGTLTQVTDWPSLFEQCDIDPCLRPEQVDPDTYVRLTEAIRRSIEPE